MMTLPPYVADILSQPQALQAALEHYAPATLDHLAAQLGSGEFDRMILTGMGASYTGLYPAWLTLTRLPIAVNLLETAELLHYAKAQITPRTLLCLTSQSGYSAEIVTLLDTLGAQPPAVVLGITNDLESPVGRRTHPTLGIHSGSEATVSTRSYLNTLAVSQLAALQLAGGDVQQAIEDLKPTVDQVHAYLAHWEETVAEWKERIGLPKKLLFVGRGPSLAAVWTGAMIMKEGAKCAVEGMSASQFRHGPLELADPDLTLVVYEGDSKTAAFNRGLALEVIQHGGKAIWISSKTDPELPTMPIPYGASIARCIYEILPLQMLSIALAEQSGVEPGKFRNMGKITRIE